jgi:alkylresorcinol/alkylpyrone synthase
MQGQDTVQGSRGAAGGGSAATSLGAGAPRILGAASALPKNYAEQEALIGALRGLWGASHFNVDRLEQLHRAVQVTGRHLALPLDEYAALTSFGKRNDAWLRCAVELGGEAASAAIEKAGLGVRDIDHVFFTTVTGIAAPSVDARLVNRLGLRPDVKRSPFFGLGCVAGAAGIARASDYLRGFPGHNALLLSVELCSLTLQREDMSVANIIASGLFGDGAAAVVLGGASAGAEAPAAPRPGPQVLATASVFYPDTERVMGWDVVDGGFKIVLSAKVPQIVRDHIRGDVERFLGQHGLGLGDVRHVIAHTGGPKVLEAFEQTLSLPAGALERSWASLREVGNLSSASVLFVLADLMASGDASPGDLGLMVALGPGFCAELLLLRW